MTPGEHPLIALGGLLSTGERPGLVLANRYADAVLKAGGVPVAIPPVGGPADLARLVERVDGVILTGGDDFTTEPLGLGPTHPAAQRTPIAKQELDLALARQVLERGLPVLGICYGMQVLGLCEGAGLIQHLPEERPGSGEHAGGCLHPVRVEGGTKLAGVLGTQRLDVVSRHHQALCDVPAPWSVVARDDGGLCEAIERADHPFALGVQWHPELAPEGHPAQRVFRGLVGAAAMARSRAALAAAGGRRS